MHEPLAVMPTELGSVAVRAKNVVTAASAADPPSTSTSRAINAARGSSATTVP